MALAAGDLGIDYSYARPDLDVAVSSGARFFIRYTAGAASAPGHPSHAANAGKLITPAEFARLDARADIKPNDEWYEDRVTERLVATVHGAFRMTVPLRDDDDDDGLRGITARLAEAQSYATQVDASGLFRTASSVDLVTAYLSSAGAQDGAAAYDLWRSCGLNRGAAVACSWDAAPSSALYGAVAAYLTSHQQAMNGGYYVVDLYAGTPALRDMLSRGVIQYGWRPNAGSWSNDGLPYQPDLSTAAKRAAFVAVAKTRTPARLIQTGNYWFNKSADENILVDPTIGSHRQAAGEDPSMAITKADLVTLVSADGVLAAPSDAIDYPTNKFWSWGSHITNVTTVVRGLRGAVAELMKTLIDVHGDLANATGRIDFLSDQVSELSTKVDAIAAATGVDPHTLADVLIDALAVRLEDRAPVPSAGDAQESV